VKRLHNLRSLVLTSGPFSDAIVEHFGSAKTIYFINFYEMSRIDLNAPWANWSGILLLSAQPWIFFRR